MAPMPLRPLGGRLASTLLLALLLPAGARAICDSDDQCTYPKVCRNGFCTSSTLPDCSTACNITTSCSTACLSGVTNTTCGAYGNCYLAPCTSVCTSSSSCTAACEMDGYRATCGLHGVCFDSTAYPCAFDKCLNSSCRRPAAGLDADADGVPDRLEYDLTYRYFPTIWLQYFDRDLSQTYSYDGHPIPYRVHAISSPTQCAEAFKCLEIRFGTAYFRDTGDPFWGGGHLGDAEFYGAVVMRTTAWSQASASATDWVLVRDFTSAHRNEPTDSSVYGEYGTCPPSCAYGTQASCESDPRCGWFPGRCIATSPGGDSCLSQPDRDLCEFNGCSWQSAYCHPRGRCYSSTAVAGARTLYAAEGKHALYHSDAECDAGNIAAIDECPTNSYNWRNYVNARLQNVGEGATFEPFDHFIQHPDRCQLYDVWGGALFGESSPYSGQFALPMSWDLP